MLVAFAAENFLKGIIVAKGLAPFPTPELPGILKTHKLQKLHKCAAPMTTVPPYLLDLLTYYSVWRGRYPMPTSIGEFWPIDDQGRPTVAGYSWSTSIPEMALYCDGLEAELLAAT